MTGCSRGRGAASPARDRPPGPRCRTAKSRRRAGSVRPRASDHARWCRAASVDLFVFLIRLSLLLVDLAQHLAEAVRLPLAHHVVVHGAQLLTDLALDIASETALGLVALVDIRLHVSGPIWLVFVGHCLASPAQSGGALPLPLRDD